MKILDSISPYAHWFLRLALASVFLYHGLVKFPNLAGMAGMMNMPVVLILVIALLEVCGSLLVLLGGFFMDWMTRIGALFLMPSMLGAIFIVHWGQWNFMASRSHPAGGIEFQVTLLCIQLYLFIKGNNVKAGNAA
jgi:putative oxidoreductase